MSKKFVCIKQQDLKDCGPTYLAMISQYYGLPTSISKIIGIASTDLNRNNVQDLIESDECLGFELKGVRMTDRDALNKLSLPAISHVVVDGGLLHCVVIYKIKKNYVETNLPGILKLL